GRVDVDITGANSVDEAQKVLIQSDDEIVVAGTMSPSAQSGSSYISVVRLDPDGSLDTGFNTTGIIPMATEALGGSGGYAFDIAQQSTGKLLVGYFSQVDFVTAFTKVLRLNTDGTTDLTFGTSARITTSQLQGPRTLQVQSDDKILIVGGPSFGAARFSA